MKQPMGGQKFNNYALLLANDKQQLVTNLFWLIIYCWIKNQIVGLNYGLSSR